VCLGGQRADDEPPGDLAVGEACGDELSDLALSVGQLGKAGRRDGGVAPRSELRDQSPRDAGSEKSLARSDDLDGAQELEGPCLLQQEAAGAGPQGAVGVLVEIERGEHQDPRGLEVRV
jgi:hypothetical protein